MVLERADGERVVLGGEAFRGMDAKDERVWLEGARGVVMGELEGLVGELGWKGARKALMAGGGG